MPRGELDSYAKVGFNIGVTVDFRLSDKMYLITGMEYTVKGANIFLHPHPIYDNYGETIEKERACDKLGICLLYTSRCV